MKNFWRKVSKKDFFFVLLLFIAAIGYSIFESANKVQVDLGTDSCIVSAPKYNMTIPYNSIDSLELVDMPDAGYILSGRDDMAVRFGTWTNETWGEYCVCANLQATNCIVARLNDGSVSVFSIKNNSETASLFSKLEEIRANQKY